MSVAEVKVKTVKVVFGVPTEGHTPVEAFQSIRLITFHHGVLQADSKAKNLPVQFEFYDRTAGRMFTPMARELMAQTALQLGADYLFMMDDDMLAPADLFDRLYRHDVDVVAALAFTRNPPYSAVLYEVKEGYDPHLKRRYALTQWIKNFPKGKLVECDAAGFGAVLIKVDVLRNMKPPYFMCSSGTGEDIWFCMRAKQEARAKIFMDTSTEIGHIGSPIIVDSALNARHNDPEEMERIYGPYKKYGVYDVRHLPQAEKEVKNGTVEEVLAL